MGGKRPSVIGNQRAGAEWREDRPEGNCGLDTYPGLADPAVLEGLAVHSCAAHNMRRQRTKGLNMESGYNSVLPWLVGAILVAVAVLILTSIEVCDRLRKIHHSLRNIEHHAKHLHHTGREEWQGEDTPNEK
jgi:hypothetical protein